MSIAELSLHQYLQQIGLVKGLIDVEDQGIDDKGFLDRRSHPRQRSCRMRLETRLILPHQSEYKRLCLPTFLTLDFQILACIQGWAPLGLSTWTRSPTKMCSFLVPRSRSRISVYPLLAAFKAAWRGDLPVKTPISLPSVSRSAKFLVSFSFSSMVKPPRKDEYV